LLPRFALSSCLRYISSREGGNIESEAWGWSWLTYSSNRLNKRACSTIEADKDWERLSAKLFWDGSP
jgi:hypothetical protein